METECGNFQKLDEHDRREITAFQRFLTEVAIKPNEGHRIPREFPGWLPYCLGHFLEYRGGSTSMHPPEGYGSVPVTAWTFPG